MSGNLPADAVACPSCSAPPGITCNHADRAEAARIASVEWGICGLCDKPLARLTDPVTVVHPDPDHAAVCPPLPPVSDWNARAELLNQGLSPGHPGVEHFIPNPEVLLEEGRRLANVREDLIAGGANPDDLVIPLAPAVAVHPVCPECTQGKHDNCTRTVPEPGQDDSWVTCGCFDAGHP